MSEKKGFLSGLLGGKNPAVAAIWRSLRRVMQTSKLRFVNVLVLQTKRREQQMIVAVNPLIVFAALKFLEPAVNPVTNSMKM